MNSSEIQNKVKNLYSNIGQVIVGQQTLIERLLIGILTEGHILVEGVPGLAKTTIIKALSQALDLSFKRLQFTPDLLPADIIGTQMYSPADHQFEVKKGPIFAHLILADEINRAPAKVQSALLEAMQERQVTIGGETFPLPSPFLVMATQNPIEQEGTYQLPEAELDRFLFKVIVNYPTRTEEIQIMKRMQIAPPIISPSLSLSDLKAMKLATQELHMEEKLYGYVADIVMASRTPEKYHLNDLKPFIEMGASPRASINITKAAKAFALLQGRNFVTPDDIKNVGFDILRHRLMLSYEAEAQNINVDSLLLKIFDTIDIP